MKKQKKNEIAVERYSPAADIGLNKSQVAARTESGLTNKVKNTYSKNYINIFVGNICTFFNLLGLIVAIALIIIGAPISRFFFVLVYLANISIGIIQEIRAKHCIDKLTIVANKTCTVIRDGMKVDVSSTDIVLDDIIVLSLGNQIPTDCVILKGKVEVNESMLTGESVPVKKRPGDMLFAGSFITSGICYVQAIKVGKDNYVETLSQKAKKYKKPQSELMNSLKLIIRTIGFIIVPLAAAYMIKAAILPDFNVFSAIDGTATVVIGMIPSGMFLLTSMALAVGIIKLYKKNTLVQDLYSLEMLARVDTICFDKTGTITDGRMKVKDVVPLKEIESYNLNELIGSMLASLKDNNQTAIALYNYFGQSNHYKSVAAIPFNSVIKLSAVTFENIGTFCFGAPEFVLSKAVYKEIEAQINQYASMGLRVLILAHSKNPIVKDQPPKDFLPAALIVIEDNIREDAISTIKWFKENNVDIKVISGDNPITVSEVSKRVGIDNADKYISLEGLTDQEVFDLANKYTVFGRVSPEQKAILVKALKTAGHVTAMTGDGVNDILALKEADCAVTVAAGSEAAKNVSHLVLMDNNFNSLPKVVYEGRRVINNIKSSASLYLMKTMFTFFMALIILFIPSLKNYPFSLSQMILLEVFVIGVPSFFLSLQPNDECVKGKFISYVLSKSLPSATLMAFNVLLIALCKIVINQFDAKVYTSMAVLSLTYAGLVSLYYICKPLNKYRSILYFTNLAIVLLITLYAVSYGLPLLGIEKMTPFAEYWHHILLIITVIVLDTSINRNIHLLFDKIKLPKTLIKRKKHLGK